MTDTAYRQQDRDATALMDQAELTREVARLGIEAYTACTAWAVALVKMWARALPVVSDRG